MPRIYLEPTGGLGNRLIQISSAIRLADKINYEFSLSWSESLSGLIHFPKRYSDLFDYSFDQVEFPISNKTVFLPSSISQSRTVIDPNTFSSQDVLLREWGHFIFLSSDSISDQASIQSEIVDILLRITRPTIEVNEYIYNNYIGLPHESAKLILAIHLRQGASLTFTPTANHYSLDLPSLAVLIPFLYENVRPDKIFISGQVPEDIENVIKSTNLPYALFIHHDFSRFPNSPSHAFHLSNQHIIKFVSDFTLLTRSKLIVGPAISTFSAVASLIGGASRIIFSGEKWVQIGPVIGGGAGL